MPREVIRVLADYNAGLFVLVDLRHCKERARPAQRETVALAVILCGSVVAYSDEVIMSMACGAAVGVYGLLAEVKREALNMALSRPCAVERYHVVVHSVQLHAARKQAFQLKRVAALVGDLHRARDYIHLLEHAVLQNNFQPSMRVLADKVKRCHIVVGIRECGGQPFELLLAFVNLIVLVVYLAGGHAELVLNLHTRLAEIRDAACGVLYRGAVKRMGTHSVVDCRNKRFTVRYSEVICKICLRNCGSVV